MDDLNLQLLVLFTLLLCIAGGYRIWIQPRKPKFAGKLLLLVMIATMCGGILGSIAWWIDDPRGFAWDLEPLAARMLAGAGWAFGIATFAALQRPTVHRIRLVLWMLVVYLLPLTVAIVAFHLAVFDFSQPISYAFFVTVLALLLPTLGFLVRQPEIDGHDLGDTVMNPKARYTDTWLRLLLIVIGLWGLALFLAPNGPIASLWPWAGMELCSRLIGTMLLTIAAAIIYTLSTGTTTGLTLAVTGVYSAGVVVANVAGMFSEASILWPYVIVFGAVGVGSFYFLWQAGRALRTGRI